MSSNVRLRRYGDHDHREITADGGTIDTFHLDEDEMLLKTDGHTYWSGPLTVIRKSGPTWDPIDQARPRAPRA